MKAIPIFSNALLTPNALVVAIALIVLISC